MLAAQTLETDVETILVALRASPAPWDDGTVRDRLRPPQPVAAALSCGSVDLTAYDRLLRGAAAVDHDAA